MGQAGRGGRAVVGGGAALAQLPVERAAAGRPSGETNTVRGGRTANAVGGSNGSSLIGNSARAENKTKKPTLERLRTGTAAQQETQNATFYGKA